MKGAWVGFIFASLSWLLAVGVYQGMAAPPLAAPQAEYEFVRETNRWVIIQFGKEVMLGQLDKNGEFQEELRLNRVETINKARRPNEEVYEYRGGSLIKGNLDKDGNFVPQLDSEITSFKNYRYSPQAPRIYNLPGKFVKKGK